MRLVRPGSEEEDHPVVAALSRLRARLRSIQASFRLSKEDADDLLHDLVLLAIRKLKTIEDLDAWLLGTARNLCLAHVRKRRRREWLDLAACPEPGCPPPQERLDRFRSVKRVLSHMPRESRRCLLLKAMGFSRAEIAIQTGHSPSMVNTLVAWGKGRLAAELGVRMTKSEPSGASAMPSWSDFTELLAHRYQCSGTARTYGTALRVFARWCGADGAHAAVIDLLRGGEVAAQETAFRYRAALRERGVKGSTINVYMSALKAAVRIARQRSLVDWSLEVTREDHQAAAQAIAKECPILPVGGSVEIRETESFPKP